jgi:hypothetical protein
VLRELDHPRTSPRTRAARAAIATLVGKQHAGTRPLDEDEAELVLELVNLHGKRGLRHRAGFRGAAEVLLARQGVEVAELFERHMRGHKKL